MISKMRLTIAVCAALTSFSPLAIAEQHHKTVLNQLVYEIRNPDTKGEDFRRALEKIGEYLAIEVMDLLEQKRVEVQTLTNATASHFLLEEQPVLVTILRAGVPLCMGVHKVFPDAEVGFIGMSRNEETLQPDVEYVAIPDIKDKCVILADTMIATAGSILDAVKIIEARGPRKIYVVGAIASEPGIQRIKEAYPSIHIIAAAVDPTLNEKGYIVPGLGDAGDRAYGHKH
ncbi:MAG: uracil phosphoribosyltransferase [Verrucomicrobia bacterium]|nr:uracil phosphoribosyltransferase [Verrucomicrobiota bacterium]